MVTVGQQPEQRPAAAAVGVKSLSLSVGRETLGLESCTPTGWGQQAARLHSVAGLGDLGADLDSDVIRL
eukprot:1800710-Rhodomonas_salina.1